MSLGKIPIEGTSETCQPNVTNLRDLASVRMCDTYCIELIFNSF